MSSLAPLSSRKRPRHFQQGPDEAEDEQRQPEEAAAAAQPPAARLYRHALESIFGFLSLKGLSAVLAVSRSWSSAVGSMGSIDAAVETLAGPHALMEACASGLARHIGTLGSKSSPGKLGQESLYLVGLRITRLHTLRVTLQWSIARSLRFPPSLTKLDLSFGVPNNAPLQINLAILAVNRLPKLHSLALHLPRLTSALAVSFAPLRHATQLQTLRLVFDFGQNLNLQQADELRAIPSLTELGWPLSASAMRMLLRPPHDQLPWQKLQTFGPLTDELAGLLARLP